MGIDWSLAVSVVLTGLALVFSVLLVLILTVELTSRMVKSAPKSTGAVPAKTAPAAVLPKTQSPNASQAPRIESGIEGETVAAIMAAISCMADSGSDAQYTVRSISRAKSERPVWGFAGMQQNTRPF